MEKLETVEVFGVKLDVYYNFITEADPLGTGDSPTEHEIDIYSIEDITGTQNLQDLLGESVIEKIIKEISLIEARR